MQAMVTTAAATIPLKPLAEMRIGFRAQGTGISKTIDGGSRMGSAPSIEGLPDLGLAAPLGEKAREIRLTT
jgi:hypothetical protein